jgi:hypothetical protein
MAVEETADGRGEQAVRRQAAEGRRGIGDGATRTAGEGWVTRRGICWSERYIQVSCHCVAVVVPCVAQWR